MTTIPVRIWPPDLVAELNKQQARNDMHPFTCANRGDGQHRDNGRDIGVLIATVHGWICPFCEYTQDWSLMGPGTTPRNTEQRWFMTSDDT